MATDLGGDACPLCGGEEEERLSSAVTVMGPSRVALRKRKLAPEVVALVGAGEEAAALREMVTRQQSGIEELQEELEAERCAAEGAASESMSMILRLQREKSEAMMEARQFRRYAEERFAHEAAEVAALHDAIALRDASVQSLSAQLRACRFRLLQLGFLSPSSLPSSPKATVGADEDCTFADDYPTVQWVDQLQSSDIGTPLTHHLLNGIPGQASDKGVIRASPRRSRHVRTLSSDSLFAYNGGITGTDEFPLVVEQDASDCNDDCDRIYTVDAVHGVPVAAPDDCCYFGTSRGNDLGVPGGVGSWADEQEIQKLSARLQALEADRESMRQAIMSMGTEKTQAVMLKEITQHLCKEAAPLPAVSLKMWPPLKPVVSTQRKLVKRQPFFAKVFIVTVIKCIVSVFCWRRKSNRIRYPLGLCGSNVGLMLLLDRAAKQSNRRFLKRS